MVHFDDAVFTVTKNIILKKNLKHLATWENIHNVKRKAGIKLHILSDSNLIKKYVALLKKQWKEIHRKSNINYFCMVELLEI